MPASPHAAGEHVVQVEARGLLELRVPAGGGVAVRAPAEEPGRMTEAATVQMLVAHLDHPLRPERHKREVLARVPAAALAPAPAGHRLAGHPAPRVLGHVADERLELGEQLLAAG